MSKKSITVNTKEVAVAKLAATPELQPDFFRKQTDIEYFEIFIRNKFFDNKHFPIPEPSPDKQTIIICNWPIFEYLFNISIELGKKENGELAVKALEIIKSATQEALSKKYHNYRVWYQFSKIIQNLPLSLLKVDDVNLFLYWLQAPYDHGLVYQEIGENIFLKLVREPSKKNIIIAKAIFESLYKVKIKGNAKDGTFLVGDLWQISETTKKIAKIAGEKFGKYAASVYKSKLEKLIDSKKSKDDFSYIWRPAIEEHKQNQGTYKSRDIIISGLRECLIGFVDSDRKNSKDYIEKLLSHKNSIFNRVAIYVLNMKFIELKTLLPILVNKKYFNYVYRHEMWHLLHEHFNNMPEKNKKNIRKIILEIGDGESENDNSIKARRLNWLSAIKDCDKESYNIYNVYTEQLSGQPENPDFPFFITTYVGDDSISPYTIEDLIKLPIKDLVDKLLNFKNGAKVKGSREGLSKAFRAVLRLAPEKYFKSLQAFLKITPPYFYQIIEVFKELSFDKRSELDWDSYWREFLMFCQQMLKKSNFITFSDKRETIEMLPTQRWCVEAIASLIEEASRNSSQYFSIENQKLALNLLSSTLENAQHGDCYELNDPVHVALNSEYGRCFNALVSLALYSCRINDSIHGNHKDVWKSYQYVFEREVESAFANNIFEVPTFFGKYLPQFSYMSEDWCDENINKFFNFQNKQHFICAMSGYGFISKVYARIYKIFKSKRIFEFALDEDLLNKDTKERIIETIAVAYLSSYEELNDNKGLISFLIERFKDDEILTLTDFIGGLDDKFTKQEKQRINKIWSLIQSKLDLNLDSHKNIASSLCSFIKFLDSLPRSILNLLERILPYASGRMGDYHAVEFILKISENNPSGAYRLWISLLKGTLPSYPEDDLKTALLNIAKKKDRSGRSTLAIEISDSYITKGSFFLSDVLKDIL